MEAGRPAASNLSDQLARSQFSDSAHHGKTPHPLPRSTIFPCRLIHARALIPTATRHNVGSLTERQERHKGLLICPGQGPQWYASHLLCAIAPTLTLCLPATSNDPWGPTGTDMADIARITFNSSTDFYEVMDMLDKRLNDKGKNWRHVLKSLKVLDYCLHEGSELVVTWARKNIYIIKTLREFIYLDEEGRDVCASSMLRLCYMVWRHSTNTRQSDTPPKS